MASGIPTPEQSAGILSPPAAATAPKPQRVLACVLCQQRKVKCDRRFPCGNCIKSSAQCVPAALVTRQRRRRFPERDLLDRLRHYEDLLRKNSIPFKPLHAPVQDRASPKARKGSHEASQNEGQAASVEETTAVAPPNVPEFGAKNFWHAMNRRNSSNNDSDDEDNDEIPDADSSDLLPYLLRHREVKKAWDQLYDSNDHLLFCSRNTNIELSTLHPSQVQIFKIWQIYLRNVDPLLKVTHTPSLQARIIDAASDVSNISPPLEALMFSIYCVSVFSLSQEECRTMFGTPRQDILRGYQMGAREALLSCGFLRSGDRDCLTALHLYLISVKPDTDPRSLSSILAATLRIAQRMGIHSEAINTKHSVFEAELRRRLWWSLILFEARISEMTEFKTGMLLPTWDCKLPLNVNDFDLRSEMKNPPPVYGQLSEALFAVVRSEVGDFTRHSSFHLDFVNPALKSIARRASSGPTTDLVELAAVERMLEDKYLKLCDPDNPLHFMTIWVTRGSVAKTCFVHHLATCSRTNERQNGAERDTGLRYALSMLECDTKLMESSLTEGYRWLIYLNFPFPAYVHLVQDLRKRPLGDHAEKAWKAMSDNSSARFMHLENKNNPMERKDNPFFKIFAGVVMQAWAAREAALRNVGQLEVPPTIVTQIRQRLSHFETMTQTRASELRNRGPGSDNSDLLTPEPMDFGSFGTLYNMSGYEISADPSPFPSDLAQAPVEFNGNQWGWPAANWNSMLGHGW